MNKSIFSLSALIMISASLTAFQQRPEVINRQIGPDIMVSTVSDSLAEELTSKSFLDDDCLNYIKSRTCLSDKAQMGFDPNCSVEKVTPDLLAQIPELLNTLPAAHRKVFCGMSRLQIQPNITSIAYATMIQGADHNSIGLMIGVRADAIVGNIPFDLWSWKEQLNFGLSKPKDPAYVVSDLGPRIRESVAGSKIPFVLHVFVHEISHLLDFMNSANLNNCDEGTPESPATTIVCKQDEKSYGLLSWPQTYSFLADGSDWPGAEIKAKYLWLSQFCYYNCTKFISPANINEAYGELAASNFLTPYAASNPMDDFAEASSIYLLQSLGIQYQVIGPDKSVLFDSNQAWQSSALAQKRKWLEDFYARPDLIYKIEPRASGL